MSGLDWPGLMRAGLNGLRLHPAEFWALSPAELAMMLGERGQAAGLDRAGFEALLQAFPDHGAGDGHDASRKDG
ncbi:phage tail assembly chaperone [Rhodobacteraceae bacterium]|nr:phage tail assembly chaperone [Paracoccaceae bacterium]